MPRWENPTPEQLADTVLARIGESPTFGVVYPYLRPATFTNDVAGVLGEILRARYPDTELSVEALGRRGLLIRAIGRAIVPNLATGSGLPADHSEWEEVDHRVSVGPTGLYTSHSHPALT